MKIAYFADGIWAVNAFLKIKASKHFKIVCIILRYKNPDKNLIKLALQYKIPYFIQADINDKAFIKILQKYKADYLVSMSFNQIFKKSLLKLYPQKIINCHTAKLPFYRGRNVLTWALINDEKEFGISVHFVDEGIDTGDIILQKSYKISDKDDYHSLLEKCYKECAKLLFKALELLYYNKITIKKQKNICKYGFYCPMRKNGDELIDFNQNSRELFNFIRALNAPNLGAKAFIKQKEIRIYKACFIKDFPQYKAINGAVVGIENKAFYVKTKDSVLKITHYKYEGKIKISDRLEGN